MIDSKEPTGRAYNPGKEEYGVNEGLHIFGRFTSIACYQSTGKTTTEQELAVISKLELTKERGAGVHGIGPAN